MNKKLKVLIAVLLCSNLITANVAAQDLSNMKEESKAVEQEIEDSKAKLDELENKKSSIISEINDLDNELKEMENQLEDLNLKIGQSQENIVQLEKKSKELEFNLSKNKEVMAKRFRALYMNQGQGYIEMLLSSNSMSDFIERVQVLSTLVSYDNEVREEFKKNKSDLETTLKEVATVKANLEENKKAVDEKMEVLNSKREEKDNLVAKAEEDITMQEEMMAQKEDEFQKIVGMIKDMEAQQNSPSGSKTASYEDEGGQVSNGEIYSITGGIAYPITSGYGWRTSPITGKDEFQAAVDIGAPQGAPVYSLMDGVVAYSGWMNGYGNVVVINHGSISSLYAHNSQLLVSKGQSVKGGEKISLVGATGWATGPHIHFEVTNSSGEKIDPTGYYIY